MMISQSFPLHTPHSGSSSDDQDVTNSSQCSCASSPTAALPCPVPGNVMHEHNAKNALLDKFLERSFSFVAQTTWRNFCVCFSSFSQEFYFSFVSFCFCIFQKWIVRFTSNSSMCLLESDILDLIDSRVCS